PEATLGPSTPIAPSCIGGPFFHCSRKIWGRFEVPTRFLTMTALLAAAAAPPQQVSRAQYLAEYQARFAAMDTNHDGVLDSSEVAAAQQKELQAARADEQKQLEAEFAKLDTNHDGQLSKAEFLAAARPLQLNRTAQQAIAEVDTNKDGKISAAEFEARPLANFDKVDANHDGVITPAEVEAAREAAAQQR